MSARQRSAAWFSVSVLAHAALFIGMPRGELPDDGPLFQLPAEIEFGVAETELGGEPAAAPEPPPAQQAEAKRSDEPKPMPKPKTDAITLPVDAGVQSDAGASDAGEGDAEVAPEQGVDGGVLAAVSGDGIFEGADGNGGYGPGGDGTGMYAPKGATIALNVDLQRVRDSALLLETQALLHVIPEWEKLLEGSGLDASDDLTRVFVATPNLTRSSLVVSAQYEGGRARVDIAVQKLAKERGQVAKWRKEYGFDVAPWMNRGPTRRVVALIADNQLAITRDEDLPRLLAVARALSRQRAKEGFSKEELDKKGGLLAMRSDETVALWVEGVRRYAPPGAQGVPLSMRLSVNRVDQFTTELRASGRYESGGAASAALTYMDGLRQEWSNHPRVVFLGLKSALDKAVIEQERDTLVMRVPLTLHQTRFMLKFVSRALTPKDASAPPPEVEP